MPAAPLTDEKSVWAPSPGRAQRPSETSSGGALGTTPFPPGQNHQSHLEWKLMATAVQGHERQAGAELQWDRSPGIETTCRPSPSTHGDNNRSVSCWKGEMNQCTHLHGIVELQTASAYFKTVILHWGWLWPQEDMWDCLRRRLVTRGWRPPHHCPGPPTTENYSAPNVSSGQAEKPCQAGGNERCVHLANEKREGPQEMERETHVLVLSGFGGLTFRVTVHMLFAIFNPSLNCQCPPLRFFPLSL